MVEKKKKCIGQWIEREQGKMENKHLKWIEQLKKFSLHSVVLSTLATGASMTYGHVQVVCKEVQRLLGGLSQVFQ